MTTQENLLNIIGEHGSSGIEISIRASHNPAKPFQVMCYTYKISFDGETLAEAMKHLSAYLADMANIN